MLRNYFKVMLRGLLKSKVNLGINLLGLTIAMGCMILTIGYVRSDLSFDRFHSRYDDLYLLYKRNVNVNIGTENLDAQSSGLMGPTMQREYPEVVNVVRLAPWFDEVILSNDEINQKVENFLFADSTFFEVFDFRLLEGDPQRALTAPGSVVLSETLAATIFGSENPVGKSIVGIHDLEMVVTGVVQDSPQNSHIQYDAIASWSTTVPEVGSLSYGFMNNWLGQTVYTYLQLETGSDPHLLSAKFGDFMSRNFEERKDSYFLKLLPFRDIYLHSGNFNNHRNLKLGSIDLLRLLGVISTVIVLLASFNYINIATARAARRASEVGIRKVMGAQKYQLQIQFFGESVVLCTLAMISAFFLVDLTLPYFNVLTGRLLTTDALFTWDVFNALFIVLLGVSFLAGIYPAMYISSFQPAEVIGAHPRHGGSRARTWFTAIQFTATMVLIGITFLISKQTDFLKSRDLGFEKDQIVVLNLNNDISNNLDAFRNELESFSGIESVAICRAAIGNGTFGTTVIPEGLDQELSVQSFRVDFNFIDTYQMEVLEGEKFTQDGPFGLIVNETFARQAGWDQVIGKQVRFSADEDPTPVIGLVKDFNYEALNRSAVSPILMFVYPGQEYNASVRIEGGNIQNTIAFLEGLWGRYESRFPFDYYFVDEWFDRQYASEERAQDTIALFSFISIVIACLGLYGLTAFILEQRSREIGVRKVFGASSANILLILNKRFIIILAASFIVATPIIYVLGNQWLKTFPYRIDVEPVVYLTSGTVVMVISFLAISAQGLKAAFSNPIQVLREK